MKVLDFINDDVLEASVEVTCREDGTGGAEHVCGFPDLIFVEQCAVFLEDRPDRLALDSAESALATRPGQRGILGKIRNVMILDTLSHSSLRESTENSPVCAAPTA